MIYYNRKTSLKIGQLEISDLLTLKWKYEQKKDGGSGMLTLTLSNLSERTRETIRKRDIVEFEFGYEGSTVPFFYGIVDNALPKKGGVTKEFEIICYEINTTVSDHVSRSYIPGKTSEFVIRDIANQCNLEIDFLELGRNIVYTNGYNVYDKPLISIKKIAESCGSEFAVNGNKLTITTGTKGQKTGVEFDYESGLLEEPIPIIPSSPNPGLEKPSKAEPKKPRKTKPKQAKPPKIEGTHTINTLANPYIKKNVIIKVLGKFYRVVDLKISDWKNSMEVIIIE